MKENSSADRKSILMVNIAVLLFGTAGLFARKLDLPSLAITFGRVFFSSIFLGLVMLCRHISFRLRSAKDAGLPKKNRTKTEQIFPLSIQRDRA